jgi:hypothetical protein
MNRPIKKTSDTEGLHVMQEMALDDLEKVVGGVREESEIKERFSFKPLKNVVLACIHVIKEGFGSERG